MLLFSSLKKKGTQMSSQLYIPTLDDILQKNMFIDSAEAQEFSKKHGDFDFGIATKPLDMRDVFTIRFASYRDSGYLNPDFTFESELEFDEHDLTALLFYARNSDTGRLHGTGRLVVDAHGRLPMDDYYPLDTFREQIGYYRGEAKLAEFSRLISHPTGQKELNKALVRFILEFASAHIDYIVGFGRLDIKQYYDKWGFSDIVPYEPVDVSQSNGPLRPPMKFYPHYMHVSQIQWDKI